ncbi:MAG: tannase/feruloyl esterase family alpha/beta hydrolase [Vicinamibacterales bacterium]
MRNSTPLVTAAVAALCFAAADRPGDRLDASSFTPAASESLSTFTITNGRITSAGVIAAGTFIPPGSSATNAALPYASLSPFCRVAATLTPTSDSDIKIEVWMPLSDWNQRLQAVGNGGWAGSISYGALAAALAKGYAAASTDTGHSTPGASFAMNHPEKLIDYGHRAVHEMTVQAKAIVAAFYGGGPKLSLWNGCSTGGRQGVIEASKYPADYDAIIAGATPVTTPQLHGVRLQFNRMVHRTPDSYIPPEKYPAIHEAALKACDALDGVKDGIVDQPDRCSFDPVVIECKGNESAACLTPSQVETARAMYAPVKNPKSGATISFPMLHPGSELGWATLAGPQPYAIAAEAFRYVVFNDPAWDPASFDPSSDIAHLEHQAIGLEPPSPNLKPFFSRGGKLLMYHGWADQQVAPLNSISYFDAVLNASGKNAAGKSLALYLVPGMGHCQGGAGTDTFDKVAALEEWIRTGAAPAQILASHRTAGVTDRTRPLCQYPQVAKYKGSGSTDDASSFACEAGR